MHGDDGPRSGEHLENLIGHGSRRLRGRALVPAIRTTGRENSERERK